MCEGLFEAPAWLLPAVRAAAPLPPQFDFWLHSLAGVAEAERSWSDAVVAAGGPGAVLADEAAASGLSAHAAEVMSALRLVRTILMLRPTRRHLPCHCHRRPSDDDARPERKYVAAHHCYNRVSAEHLYSFPYKS